MNKGNITVRLPKHEQYSCNFCLNMDDWEICIAEHWLSSIVVSIHCRLMQYRSYRRWRKKSKMLKNVPYHYSDNNLKGIVWNRTGGGAWSWAPLDKWFLGGATQCPPRTVCCIHPWLEFIVCKAYINPKNYNVRKVFSEVYKSFVLQCTVSGR